MFCSKWRINSWHGGGIQESKTIKWLVRFFSFVFLQIDHIHRLWFQRASVCHHLFTVSFGWVENVPVYPEVLWDFVMIPICIYHMAALFWRVLMCKNCIYSFISSPPSLIWLDSRFDPISILHGMSVLTLHLILSDKKMKARPRCPCGIIQHAVNIACQVQGCIFIEIIWHSGHSRQNLYFVFSSRCLHKSAAAVTT